MSTCSRLKVYRERGPIRISKLIQFARLLPEKRHAIETKIRSCPPPAAEYARVAKPPVSTAIVPYAGLRHLGKGWIVPPPPLEDCHTGLTGSSAQAGTGRLPGTDLTRKYDAHKMSRVTQSARSETSG